MKTTDKKQKTSKAKKHTLPKIFGHTATAVCRALGKHGLKSADVRAIMKAKTILINDSRVQIQTRASVNGQRGEPASLTKEQIAELKSLIPATKQRSLQ